MKSSREEGFPKRGVFPLHATRSRSTRFSSKNQKNKLNSRNTKPESAASSSRLSPCQRPPPSKATAASRPEKRSNLVDNDVVATPLNDKNGGNNSSNKTPPVEASLSPEMQKILTKTMTPATGHPIDTVISGFTDIRKCRPRGLLAVGNALTDSTDNDNPLPLPSQASMHWLTIPFTSNCSPNTSCTSKSSANVMLTPTSAESDSCTSQFRSQLNSVARLLRATTIDTSFEFDATAAASSSSVDLTNFRRQLLCHSCCSDNEDIDDKFDSCRCSSDDEEPNIVFDDVVPRIEPDAPKQNYASGSCAESISTDGGGPLASSKDSDWDFDLQL